VPTCSTFIPPRIMQPVDNKIFCHICTTSICLKCKQVAHVDHQCAPTDSNIAKIKALDYKLCPKCGTGVMKMYGCSHIRCAACGAHWCYDCQRPIIACYKRPCRAAQDGGQYDQGESDGESDSEDEGATADHATVISPTPQWPADLITSQPVASDQVIAAEAEQSLTDEPSSEVAPAQRQRQVLSSSEGPDADSVNTDNNSQPTPEEHAQLDASSRAYSYTTAISTTERQSEASAAIPPTDFDGRPAPSSREQASSLTPRSTTPIGQPTSNLLSPSDPVLETQQQIPDGEDVNLDDPEEHDWEVESLDFGEEPEEESWDVWGCEHGFQELRKETVDEYWIRNVDKYLDCMRCFEKVDLWEKSVAEDIAKGNGKGQAEGKIKSGKELGEEGKGKMAEKAERKINKAKLAFDCSHCGVVYCGACKDELRRRKKRERKKTEEEKREEEEIEEEERGRRES